MIFPNREVKKGKWNDGFKIESAEVEKEVAESIMMDLIEREEAQKKQRQEEQRQKQREEERLNQENDIAVKKSLYPEEEAQEMI